jgi:NitT/TauT family transport system ATP-binding protein
MVSKDSTRLSARDVGLIYRKRLNKKEGGSRYFTAIEHVDLNVGKGEFVSIVGSSGCGKSTFLYILAGLNKNTSGMAYINGKEIRGPSLDRGIIMQAYALFPWRTIKKNVEFGLEVKGISKKERAETSQHYLDLVGLGDYANRYPYELSGGMKQRIAIARALAYDPEVLLMDEPFAAVDEQTKDGLHIELLRIWQETNKTIVFVTHSIEEAAFLSDRVAVMTPGPGTIKEVVDINLPRPRVRTSDEFGVYRKRIWQLLQSEEEQTHETVTEIVDLVSEPAVFAI